MLAAASGYATKPAMADPVDPAPPIQDRIAALERRCSAYVGVFAVDVDGGQTIEHRSQEAFAMCSTFKAYASARVLQMVEHGELTLDQTVFVDPAGIVANSPRTAPRAGGEMTLDELCQAALQVSDNTAANMLLKTIGGPPAITAFARSIGDPSTRLDRWETELNSAIPGDPRHEHATGPWRRVSQSAHRGRAGPATTSAARGLDAGERDVEHAGRLAAGLDHRRQDRQRRLRQHQ